MANIKDVARESGFSTATVSQVLSNGGRPVHPETRERIIRAARHLKYRPNALARGLVQKRMNTLGVVIQHEERPSETNPALMAILDGVLSAGTRHKQHVTIASIPSWEDAIDYLPTLADGRCDGILLAVPPADNPLVAGLSEAGVPFVLLGSHASDPDLSFVDTDNVAAARQMAMFLLEQGHRRIALLSSFPGKFLFLEERQEGYRQALAAWGLPFEPALVWGAEALAEKVGLLGRRALAQPPTALFCTTDICAIQVLGLLKDLGVSVPGDISVVGFDDIAAAAVTSPPLTTMRQPLSLLGDRAAEILLSHVSAEAPAGVQEFLPTELIVRQSSAAPRE